MQNGPTGAPYFLSTSNLLQVEANAREFDRWYFISFEKYEKRIWKYVIVGKAISAPNMNMFVQKLHQTITTRLAIKQQPIIESLWNKRQNASYEE